MIPIVAELVEHVLAAGIHAEKPVQSVLRFVEHIGHSVRSRKAARVELVAESLRIVAVRHQHHERRVGGRRDVLEIIGCVRPSARDVDELVRACRVIDDATVEPVNRILHDGVEPGALLPHVHKQGISRAVVRIRVDEDWRGCGATGYESVATRFPESGEVEPVSGRARSERACRNRSLRSEHYTAFVILKRECWYRHRLERAGNRGLGTERDVTELIDADPGSLGRLRAQRNRSEKAQCKQDFSHGIDSSTRLLPNASMLNETARILPATAPRTTARAS